jgi:putative ABC transport system ATP-binding protein
VTDPVSTKRETMSPVSETTPTYELKEATRSYGQNSTLVRALDALDLTIKRGEFVAVFGPSGSGKTTLLQLLGALDRPSAGSIHFEGQPLELLGDSALAELRLRAMGFVFQQFNLIPTLTASENVEAALAPFEMSRMARREAAESHLEAVGLGPRARHLPRELSGGEQQRVAIARALARSPRVVLADEPTGNLDSRNGEMVMELLARLHTELEITLVLVTHDEWIAERADRVLRLADGRLVKDSAGAVAEEAAQHEQEVRPHE